MRDPEVFLAYAPRGPGLRCALFYVAEGDDVYGWFTGLRGDASRAACYFLLEDFYQPTPTRYQAVDDADLHSAWALDEVRRHEAARLREAFTREWLVYVDDPAADRERLAYDEAELGAGDVLVRFARLAKFSTAQANWTYYSPRFEHTILRALSKRWPLDYAAE